MDGIANSVGYAGYAIAILSAVFAYINRDRYKTLIKDIYEPGNRELREQIATERERTADLSAENNTLKAQLKEKDNRIEDLKELNQGLPNYNTISEKTNQVITVISNNHKEIMKRLTDLTKYVAKENK